jgi:hypothetical protein
MFMSLTGWYVWNDLKLVSISSYLLRGIIINVFVIDNIVRIIIRAATIIITVWQGTLFIILITVIFNVWCSAIIAE